MERETAWECKAETREEREVSMGARGRSEGWRRRRWRERVSRTTRETEGEIEGVERRWRSGSRVTAEEMVR